MRIAIVTSEFPTISETFITNKVKALAASGYTVRVFANKKNQGLFQQLFTDVVNVSVVDFTIFKAAMHSALHPIDIIKSITKKNSKRLLFEIFRLHKINQFQPHIIHFEFSGIGIEYLLLLDKLTCKKIVSCRGTAEKVKLLTSSERKENFGKLMQKVDAVHCVSNDMCNTIKDYVDLSKVFVNYPSIDAQSFNRSTSYQTNAVPIILSVGRFTFPKNYLLGLLALRLVADNGKRFKWTIVATGAQYEEILFHIHYLQLQNNVELVGAKKNTEIKDLLEKADIFLLTSVYEGIANVVLEAMSMQVPVVSTACGGLPEVITNKQDGLLADVYDHNQLAKHILYLINHPTEARAMGAAARARVLENFTLQQQTDKFISVYDQLTS
jgi:glycosyltransferase involved in cell wall biosynthesis